jgi:hypothetical protein
MRVQSSVAVNTLTRDMASESSPRHDARLDAAPVFDEIDDDLAIIGAYDAVDIFRPNARHRLQVTAASGPCVAGIQCPAQTRNRFRCRRVAVNRKHGRQLAICVCFPGQGIRKRRAGRAHFKNCVAYERIWARRSQVWPPGNEIGEPGSLLVKVKRRPGGPDARKRFGHSSHSRSRHRSPPTRQ